MSSSILKSSCCTSRAPPSPDAVPSRPAIPASKVKNRISKDHVPSWVSVDTTELRAIFEEADATDSCRIKHISHKDSAKFREILEGDKFVTDSESEKVKAKKSSSTLKAVTQILKKHLSKDEGLSKRHSRNSVGTSEEEIERRAELRRIRERRIREELSNESVYDDDAKSVASPPGTPLKNDRQSAWIPGNFVPLPALSPVSLPLPELDPLEAAHRLLLDSDSSITKTPRRQSHFITPSTTKFNPTASISRRHSSPALSDWDLNHDPNERLVYVPSRKRSSIPQTPPAPAILAQRLPSLTDPAISAWRLSFSTDSRGQHLRKLSQGYAIPVTLDTELLREASPPVERWLRSPGLRSPSPSSVKLKDTLAHNFSDSHEEDNNSPDFGGVDGVEDASTSVHLHEMEISRRLASRGLQSSASTPQLSSWGSHQRGASSLSSISRAVVNERDRYLRGTSDSAPLSDRIPTSWGAVVQHRTSSIYPSAGNSTSHSRDNSLLNILSLFPGTKCCHPQVVTDAEASHSLLCLTRSPTANLSSASLSAPLKRCPRPSPDDSSLVASETESFRQREAELSVVEARFASSDLIRSRNTPLSSKFKEEFNVESERPGIQPRKLSVFNRLAKLAVKSYDGSSRMEELLDVPVPSFDAEELRTPKTPGVALFSPGGPATLLSSLPELDDTARIWGKAIKKDSRAEQVADKLHIPSRQPSAVRKKSAMEDEVPKSAFGTLFGLGRGKKKQDDYNDHKTAAEEYNERFQERLAVKELVMDSWEDEMAATAAKAKAKSKTIVKKTKPTMPDRRYPTTWARYSSVDRAERTISAGARDRIDVKDFANLGQKEDGEILWCLEHDDDGHHAEIADIHKGIREKIGDRIKHKAYKFDTGDDQFLQTGGRRGSLTVAGELEYPELEVLPFTLRTREEMEEEIRAEKEAERLKEETEEAAKKPHIPKLLFRRRANDGSQDMDGQTASGSKSEISIADPRFYDDCVILPMTPNESTLVRSQTVRVTGTEKKNKHRTWHGKDWEGYLATIGSADVDRRGRNASMGTMVMRKSTDDHFTAVERMERREKERVLSVVEVAWGDGQQLSD
ncbi:hypothetical protein VTL71DRAFT_10591 [Oculimacula yallundae]|uniref:Uncharacterized protein n=1 Tax=Oculimacula yallundae TaxID=86028 RepID=A0ABR4CTY1_9HELO